jgi:hypothetical protein
LGEEYMPGTRHYRYRQPTLTKLLNSKIPFEDIPGKTMKVTIHALRWIFMLIFLFITVGILVLFATGGQQYLQVILGYSITGFFTFFMGYFGWLLAQGIIEMITGKESHDNKSFSYYFSRKNRFNYR